MLRAKLLHMQKFDQKTKSLDKNTTQFGKHGVLYRHFGREKANKTYIKAIQKQIYRVDNKRIHYYLHWSY